MPDMHPSPPVDEVVEGEEASGSSPRQRLYQIGAVGARTELSHQTLRHWDEVGLVSPSVRSEGGFRLYSEADIERLIMIRRMKPLEFTLDEMRQLLQSLDVLNDPASTEPLRAAALVYVEQCRERAQDSIARLRKRLAYAIELSGLLDEAGRNAVAPR